jgi:pilus assembly protein CpaF
MAPPPTTNRPMPGQRPPMGAPRATRGDTQQLDFETLKRLIHTKLVDKLDLTRLGDLQGDTLRREIRLVVEHLCDSENPLLNRSERERLIEEILDETLGFGPLELLMKEEGVADIMINGPKKIFVEKNGKIIKSNVTFRDNAHLLQILDRIVSRVGRRVDETSPMVDARLPDGSRLNAIIPPLALDGPSLTIRKFGSKPLTLENLLSFGAFTTEMVMLLEGAMKARLNVIISGGTGSGKTTLLNTLSSFIQQDHRVITIEDAAELQLQQDHVLRLETRPANIEGKGMVTATDLVKNALRMRPDRIIIGECNARHAAGDEHRSRRLDDHRPLEQPARRRGPYRDDGDDVGNRAAAEGHPSPAVVGCRPDHSGEPSAGRSAKDHVHYGGPEHGAGHDHHAGHFPVHGRRRR